MKNLINCIIVLLISSFTFACGPWYPYGEETRFSLFSPSVFVTNGYSGFNYNANLFGEQVQVKPEEDPNILLWYSYCQNIPKITDVYLAIYELKMNDINDKDSPNSFVQYLHHTNDKGTINYLTFAKSCSPFSQVTNDPWERKGDYLNKQRTKKIKAAEKKSASESNIILKKRYAFLALRLAYYAGNQSKVNSLFNKYFKGEKNDIIDYWAAYFKLCFEPSSAERNAALAQIFEKCQDKRFAVNQLFDRKIDMSASIKASNNAREKGNVIVMYALRNPDKSVDLIKSLEEIDPDNPQLTFLILREINKIEDWVLTPKYNLFPPSISGEFYYSEDQERVYDQRVSGDRQYAVEFSNWLENSEFEDKDQHYLQQLATAYLYQIAGKNDLALSKFNTIVASENPNFTILKSQLALLVNVDAAENENWIDDKKNIALLQNNLVENHSNFLFSIARETEYNKQTALAACLFSYVNMEKNYWESEIWKAPNNVINLYGDFFTNYFFYLDAQYTAEEVQDLITRIEKNDFKNDWVVKNIAPDIERLYDLVGTKHLRDNELDKAITAFSKVSDETWNKEEYSFSAMLNANPFYTDFYTEHEKSDYDTVRYNKYQIAKKLKSYIEKGDDVNNSKRARNYFIAANCYLNMTFYGNSWMMRRYWWSTNQIKSGMNDDDEFARCDLAKKYYKKAHDSAKTEKQKALCLRMMGRCEKYARFEENEYDWNFDYEKFGGYSEYIFTKNKTYKELKNKYPEDYEILISNCESFSAYYASF